MATTTQRNTKKGTFLSPTSTPLDSLLPKTEAVKVIDPSSTQVLSLAQYLHFFGTHLSVWDRHGRQEWGRSKGHAAKKLSRGEWDEIFKAY